jgi:cyclase
VICLPRFEEGASALRRDRVSEDIFVFVSDLYVQVTSTVMLTEEGALIVDAMPFPSEAREIIAFVEGRLGPDSVRYLILTHHHADHVYGSYLFRGAEVIAHDSCRELLARLGPTSLARAKRQTPALAEVELRLPDVSFDKEMHVQLGHRHLHLLHTPGHTPDGISVYETNEHALCAGDLAMPVPHIVTGDMAEFRASLQRILALEPDFVVQGHGDVLLRGEVAEMVEGHSHYLDAITERVADVVRRNASPRELQRIDIEDCGLSRIPLDGAVSKLHMDNLIHLYKLMTSS